MPTWRMVPGSSTESLALDVALQCQVPPDIVQRAAHLFKVTPFKPPDPLPLTNTVFCGSQYPSCGHADVVELRRHVTLSMLLQLTFCSEQITTKAPMCTQSFNSFIPAVDSLHECCWYHVTTWIERPRSCVQHGPRQAKAREGLQLSAPSQHFRPSNFHSTPSCSSSTKRHWKLMFWPISTSCACVETRCRN